MYHIVEGHECLRLLWFLFSLLHARVSGTWSPHRCRDRLSEAGIATLSGARAQQRLGGLLVSAVRDEVQGLQADQP